MTARWPLALPFLAVPALVAATTGEVAIPPRLAVLAGAGVLLVIAAGSGGARPRPALDLPVAALLGAAASHLLFEPGLPFGHDTIAHLWASWSAGGALAEGQLLAPWLHGLGLGMPLHQFYGPLPHLTVGSLVALGLSPAAALKAALLLCGAGGAAAMELAVARWTGDRRSALVGATAYAFAPYRLLDAHYRVALAETAAMAVLPLVLLAAAEAARHGGARRQFAAAAAGALLLVIHPPTALATALAAAAWPAVGLVRGAPGWPRPARAAGRWAATWLLAAALAGAYAAPAAANLGATAQGRYATGELPSTYAAHGLAARDLLERRLWSGLALSEEAGGASRGRAEMPLYFGWGLLALLPLGAGAGGRGGTAPAAPGVDRATAPGLVAVALLALALTLAPLAGWSERLLPALRALFFPWRFLAVASCAAAAAAGCAAARLRAEWGERRHSVWLAPALVVGLLLVDAAPYTGAADWFPPYTGFGSVRHEPGCGRPRGCWAHEPLPAPPPARVAGYFLPPDRLDVETGLVWHVFPEYATPAVARTLLPTTTLGVLGRAGAEWLALPEGRRRLFARPYAFWRPPAASRAGTEPLAAPRPLPFSRRAGEIRVALDGRPGRVVVLEQWFPGWQVWTGRAWRAAEPNREGVLVAPVEGGRRELRFRFRRWRADSLAGLALSGLTLAGLAVAARRATARAGDKAQAGA